jgi:hypothetical protein
MNNEFVEIYDCVRMIIRYSIVKCIKYRAIGWNKAKYVDILGDIQQLPTQLQAGVWCKNLKDKLRYGISFKKTHSGCNLVLRSILQGGSLC